MAALKEHNCPNCGSELNYDADKNDLKCLHCGAVFSIEKSTELLTETGINVFNEATLIPISVINTVVYKCTRCGQETEASADIAFFECRSCGNNVVNPEAYSTRAITPTGIIPFSISKQEALDAFANWIGKGFWNDGDLKKLSVADKLVGHYVPFWTFDCDTQNSWQGYAGRYYYKTVTRRNANGQTVQEQIRHTDWTFRSGSFERFFDDILVCGNKMIPQAQINDVYPYNLSAALRFDEEYLLGWQAKAYDKDLQETYNLARRIIDGKVEAEAVSYLQQDTYRDLQVQTQYRKETFKQIILPVWLCQYLFKGKSYYFILNGQTGKISGDKPLSVSKITAAIIIALLIIVALYFLSYN